MKHVRTPRLIVALTAVCFLAVAIWIRCGPIAPELRDLSATTSTVVVDRRGVPLYEALSGDGTRSISLSAADLPPVLIAATLAAEDRRFWSHPGVDPLAIARALKRNVRERRLAEGGSTITQQVAKLLLNRQSPGRDRGLLEKLREAVLALRLEHHFAKRDVLALYLNLASYGNQIVGVGRASRAYFNRDASLLTPAQAAFLAGLPQRPSGFNPYRRFDAALARQRVVLERMERLGYLPAPEASQARDEQLVLTRDAAPFLAPHFVEMALASLGTPRPPRLETTIDADLQADIAGIIRSQRPSLERHGAANVAVVVLDNARAEWLAWEGSGAYFDDLHGGRINGATAGRQPGSALKPFTYALAFEEGFTPASVLPDIPSHFPTAEAGVLYSPRNYDGRYRGPLLARRALAGSENVPAVALASELGVPRLLRLLTRAGFSTFQHNVSFYGLGLTLGNAEVRLDELVAAYSAVARGGRWVQPTWIRTASGAQRQPAPRAERRLVSARTAFWVTDILSDAHAREYIFGRGGHLEFPFTVAVKTGTSQAYHDNWTIGYTREITVGVWVGNFDRSPLRHSTGVTGAGPIFHAVMLAAVARLKSRFAPQEAVGIVPRPEGLRERTICALSGMLANEWCPTREREWLPVRDEPPCSWHHHSEEGPLLIWPAEYRVWAKQQGLLQDHAPRLPVGTNASSGRAGHGARRPISIANPPAGATYLIDPTLRREFQTLALRAVTQTRADVEWRINERVVGSSSSDSPVLWPLVPGSHRIVARDGRGNSAEATILVR